MEPLDPGVTHLGQSYRLSPLDILQANYLYHCLCKFAGTVIAQLLKKRVHCISYS